MAKPKRAWQEKRKRRFLDYSDSQWRVRPESMIRSGGRIYLRGTTVGQVKRAVGKLAKKVRRTADGDVEVIHTYNGWGPIRRRNEIPPLWVLLAKLDKFRRVGR